MNVFTSSGTSVQLGGELGRGGEAVVYRVQGRNDLLAKVYTGGRSEYRAKLNYMLSCPPSDPTRALGHASIAWPRDLLYDRHKRFIGYLMPHVREAVSMLEVFNPRRRAQILPGFNRAYLHRAARNLSSALEALHARGYIVGDLNERNVLVTPRSLVTLIDTDSFQVQEQRQAQIIVYPCPVGRSEYTPPELQGQAFRGVVRQPRHDRFGLGVLVFQLLMEGSHPFRSLWIGESDPPAVEEKINRGWFLYADDLPPEIAPPPNAPPLENVHPVLADLFMRCFSDGHRKPGLRPSAEEWADGLDEAERHLVPCKSDHLFSDHLPWCPQCGERRGRVARAAGKRAAARHVRPIGASRPAAPRTGVPAQTGSAGGRLQATTLTGGLTLVVDALTAPFVGAQQLVSRAAQGVGQSAGASMTALADLPRRALVATVGRARRPRALAMSLRDLQQVVTWTALLAVAGAAVAVAAGMIIAAGFENLQVGLARSLLAAGAAPAGLWAVLVGGLAMVIVGTFRGLADSTGRRLTVPVVRAALARGLVGLAGWSAGWSAAGLLIGVGGGEPVSPALFGRAVGPAAIGAPDGSIGWMLGWAMYGAIAGALSGTVREDPAGWATGGAVFGAAGWAAARMLAAWGGF